MIVLLELVLVRAGLQPELKAEPPELVSDAGAQHDVREDELVFDRHVADLQDAVRGFQALVGLLPGMAPDGLVGEVDAEGGRLPGPADTESHLIGPGGPRIARNTLDVVVGDLRVRLVVRGQGRPDAPSVRPDFAVPLEVRTQCAGLVLVEFLPEFEFGLEGDRVPGDDVGVVDIVLHRDPVVDQREAESVALAVAEHARAQVGDPALLVDAVRARVELVHAGHRVQARVRDGDSDRPRVAQLPTDGRPSVQIPRRLLRKAVERTIPEAALQPAAHLLQRDRDAPEPVAVPQEPGEGEGLPRPAFVGDAVEGRRTQNDGLFDEHSLRGIRPDVRDRVVHGDACACHAESGRGNRQELIAARDRNGADGNELRIQLGSGQEECDEKCDGRGNVVSGHGSDRCLKWNRAAGAPRRTVGERPGRRFCDCVGLLSL